MVAVSVWSDYVCPWCYIGTSELAKLDGRLEFTVDWQPFLLRPDAPDSGWALPAHIRARMNQPGNPLMARAKELGIKLVERDHIPSSRRAHECTEFARAHDRASAFHDNVLERYWSRGEDLSDWKCLRAAAKDAGLDADAMELEVTEGKWKAKLEEGLADAREVGVHAVPTFLMGERFIVEGAQTADVLMQAMKRAAAESVTRA